MGFSLVAEKKRFAGGPGLGDHDQGAAAGAGNTERSRLQSPAAAQQLATLGRGEVWRVAIAGTAAGRGVHPEEREPERQDKQELDHGAGNSVGLVEIQSDERLRLSTR
jgi:hypothetical protein